MSDLTEILDHFRRELSDATTVESRDLISCGWPALDVLSRACKLLCYDTPQGDRDDEPYDDSPLFLAVTTLHNLANEMINSIPFNLVPRHWLQLYTDTALLLGLQVACQPTGHDSNAQQSHVEAAIRRLDMAMIVAGAIGVQRREWILSTIIALQRRIGSPPDSFSRPAKRARLAADIPISMDPVYAPKAIVVLERPPSITEYLQRYSQSPFILRGYLKGDRGLSTSWPGVERWTSAEYLLAASGRGRVVPVEVGNSYDDSDWGQKVMPFCDFLRRSGYSVDSHAAEQASAAGPPLYLAQYGLLEQFPSLNEDILYPDYVWSEPPTPTSFPTYVPPQTDSGVIVNVWIGSGSEEIVSPAHTDPFYNCYAQVVGHKRVWLAPPTSGEAMYAYGDEPGNVVSETTTDKLADQYMTNTSKVPILRPTRDFEQLRDQFPRFFTQVWPTSLEAVLAPGDLLVFPPGWWHAMRGEGDGPAWSVSMWY